MTPFTSRPGGVQKARVYNRHGASCIRSLGTSDPDTAKDVSDFLKRLRKQRRWDALDLIYSGELKPADAYDADREGRFILVIEEVRIKALRKSVPDLSPLVKEWGGQGRHTRSEKYVKQVRAMIPEKVRYPVTDFTRGAVKRFLDSLDVERPTKNRYRAALMQFAHWLVEREILDVNPVRDVRGFGESRPREKWMSWEDAQKVCDASHPVYRALFAIMYGSGAEVGAALKLRHADFNRKAKTLHLRGSKTPWRNRTVRLEDWAWNRLHFVLDGLSLPDTQVFYRVSYDASYRAHVAACEALKLEGFTLHDARHTYAVNALKKGYRPEVVAHQLGHRDTTLVWRVYGRYVPRAEDYENVTPAASPKRKQVKRRA